MKKKTLRVAAIQFQSINRDVEANIKRASRFIQQAADEKAELVLLPELSTTGYELNERLWDFAEPKVGTTTCWLKEEARKHRIWIGASYLEAEGDDFYNSFVLMNPDGNEDGRIWKETAGSVETYLFKGRKSDHIIETDIGRIGVIVCYDGIMSAPIRRLAEASPDIILLPHSAAQPSKIPILFPQSAVDYLEEYVRNSATRFAKMFGVPVILSNKTGAWISEMVKPYPPQNGRFMGLSAIANSNGEIIVQAGNEETALVAEVDVSGTSKPDALNVQFYGRWALKVPWHFKWWPVVERNGRKFYEASTIRREKAQAASSML